MEKVVIITGASSGIGLACVRDFLDLGVYVIGIGRNLERLNQIQHEKFIAKICNVEDIEQVAIIINQLKTKYIIDGLINAAGVAYNGDFTGIKHEDNMAMVNANIIGLTNFIELILPIMRENQMGTIINLSSLADRYPRPNTSVYAATKAYVKSLSDSLRLQNAKYNIRIINVAPALIDTPLVNKLRGNMDVINVNQFSNIIRFIYMQPQNICIRDMVVAPTKYEG